MQFAKALSRDTDPRVEEIQLEFYRRQPAWRKLALVEGANRTVRVFATAGLKSRHPNASSEEIQRRLMDLLLGEEVAHCAYGPLAASDDEPVDGDS